MDKRKRAMGDDGRDRPRKAQKAQKPVFDRSIAPPAGLVAKEPPPQPKLKHQAYFEFVENTNRKKQLEYKITVDREPPPGFTFVPMGKPELTFLCKEISREKGAMIFMVSTSRDNRNELSMHTSRIGHHIREVIVEEAQATLGYRHDLRPWAGDGAPEPIPETQEAINAQADAALRELFPRIPNTDRQEIIDHAFKKGATFHNDPVVGLSKDLSLSRRVQLAVLAHIRHRHTRYDALLRETTWQHSRKTVESVCLDMIVKWRGDEENGRDTLDSILREVVVISDSEGESDEDSDEVMIVSPPPVLPRPRDTNGAVQARVFSLREERPHEARNASTDRRPLLPTTTARPVDPKSPTTPGTKRTARSLRHERRAAKKATRGFQRYQAAWEDAVDRNRGQEAGGAQPPAGVPMRKPTVYAPQASAHAAYDDPAQPPHQVQSARSSNVIYVGPARRPETTNRGPVPADGQHPTRTPNMALDNQNSPRLLQPRGGGERAPMTTRSLTNPSLPAGSHGSQFQDLLVPSIEGPAPAAMAPQFVRPLPSRKHPRDESPGPSAAYPPPQPQPSTYPAEAVQDGHVKRRRVVGDWAVPSPDQYPRSPPSRHGYTQPEPEIRLPALYSALEPAQATRDPGPRPVYYERRPQAAGTRQHPIVLHASSDPVSEGSEFMEPRRAVQEPPSYGSYRRAEHISGPPREYRGAPAPASHQRPDQNTLAPRHHDGRHETRQVQRPSAQPIFVRTVEPRTAEVQPRGGPVTGRYGTPGNRMPPQRWEGMPAQYPDRGHSLEPFYEVNRQQGFAPAAHGVPTTRPQLQEPIGMGPRHEQPHPHVLPYHGRDRPLPPRDVIVYD